MEILFTLRFFGRIKTPEKFSNFEARAHTPPICLFFYLDLIHIWHKTEN